jgi:hypothetical protein
VRKTMSSNSRRQSLSRRAERSTTKKSHGASWESEMLLASCRKR